MNRWKRVETCKCFFSLEYLFFLSFFFLVIQRSRWAHELYWCCWPLLLWLRQRRSKMISVKRTIMMWWGRGLLHNYYSSRNISIEMLHWTANSFFKSGTKNIILPICDNWGQWMFSCMFKDKLSQYQITDNTVDFFPFPVAASLNVKCSELWCVSGGPWKGSWL